MSVSAACWTYATKTCKESSIALPVRHVRLTPAPTHLCRSPPRPQARSRRRGLSLANLHPIGISGEIRKNILSVAAESSPAQHFTAGSCNFPKVELQVSLCTQLLPSLQQASCLSACCCRDVENAVLEQYLCLLLRRLYRGPNAFPDTPHLDGMPSSNRIDKHNMQCQSSSVRLC